MRVLVGVLALLLFLPGVQAGDPEFVRGDSDQDGTFLAILDAIHLYEYLIGEGDAPACEDAADANDDGNINIVDIVRMLYFAFGDADEIPAPFPDCGTDASDDDGLDCADPEGCP